VRISRASDEPQGVADLLQTRSDLARVTQAEKNLTAVQSEVQAADSSIQQAVQALDNARTLAAEGANTTLTAAGRATLATQVSGIIAQIVSASRTQIGGVYIFSGDQTNTPPYAVDDSSPTGVQQLVTAPATRLIQDATGLTFAASKTASELFGSTFTALASLRTALEANNVSDIESAAASIATAQDSLNQQGTSFYGAVQDRVSTALDLAKKFETQGQADLSNQQDTDIAAEALQITQDNTHLNAALASAAKLPTTSLFDYLPHS
jgi:flagellar hook-associated protein 3 FlgL